MIDRNHRLTGSPRIIWNAMRFRITLGILFILSILFLFFAQFAIHEQRTRMLQQIEDYGHEVAQFMAQISIVPLQKFSIYQLENYVIHIEQGKLIAYCKIYDKNGLLLTPENNSTENTGAGKEAVTPRINHFRAGIIENDVKYGHVEVGLYVDSVYSEINRTSLYIIAAFGLGLVVIGSAVSVFLHNHFVLPIQKLSKTTKTIAEGHFVTSDISTRKDEIGELADSINLMSGNLEDSYRTLENKVDERTAELYHAKNMAEKSNRHLQVVGEEVQALLDNSPVGILFVTDDYSILRVNEEFFRISGYRSDEIVGKSMRIFYPNMEQFRGFTESSEQLDKDGLFIKRTELLKNDGSVISCAVRGRRTALAGGAKGIVLNFEDITSRLIIEEELLKVKKLESVRLLARGIAHDFNNILVAILGNLSLIERFTANDEKVGNLLSEARKASLRAKDLTEKLLTFAKGSDPDTKVENLSEFLQQSIPIVLAGSSVHCQFDLEEGLWKVRMDRGQIDTVVQNIVQNAREALEEAGEIMISCSNTSLEEGEVSTLAPGRYVKMVIADSGPGIDPACIDNVFDPYFSTKEKDSIKGSGLGLSIVRSILMKHNGAINIDPNPEAGSRVIIYLPAVEPEIIPEKPPQQILPTGKGHVVIVDAEVDGHSQAEEMLQYLGYGFKGCSTLEAGVAEVERLVSEDEINLIVIVASGLSAEVTDPEVIELFKQLDPAIRLVLCYGQEERDASRDYPGDGFDASLQKPYQLLDLSHAITGRGSK